MGSEGKIRVSEKELDEVMIKGSRWAVEKGYGNAEDITVTEESGSMKGANPDKASSKAKKRGIPQLGTLGSGNHFLEVEVVDELYDRDAARAMGIEDLGQVLVLIHTGSRGFGHQVCTDYVALLGEAVKRYGISLPDRQLACAPINSPEGQDYLAAMACAANYAWANRQCILHWVRESFMKVFGKSQKELGMRQVYDVCHNIAKIEEYTINGKKERLCVHRKGATRAFPAGHPDVPDIYRESRPAGSHSRGYGALLLRRPGHGGSDEGDLRLNLPWCRQGAKLGRQPNAACAVLMLPRHWPPGEL